MCTIKQQGYIPNSNARGLRRLDGKCIAVIVKGFYNPLLAEVIPIIEEEIKQRKYATVIRYVHFDENEVDVALQLEKKEKLSGVIFLGGYFAQGEKYLKKLKIPFILSTSECHLDGMKLGQYSTLSVDNKKESYRMTEYLIRQGHKKIAVLSGIPDNANIGVLRLEGYKEALIDYGIKVDENLILPMKENSLFYSMENGYLMTKELLKSNKRFTCIFAFSDAMAIGACRAVTDCGKRIPEDYSIAGFDGIEMGKYYNPKLTTIRQPVYDIAKESVEALWRILEGRSTYVHKIFAADLIEGESVLKYKEVSI